MGKYGIFSYTVADLDRIIIIFSKKLNFNMILRLIFLR